MRAHEPEINAIFERSNKLKAETDERYRHFLGEVNALSDLCRAADVVRRRNGVDLSRRLFDFRGPERIPCYDPDSRKFVAEGFRAWFGDRMAGAVFVLTIEIGDTLQPTLHLNGAASPLSVDADILKQFLEWLEATRLCDLSTVT